MKPFIFQFKETAAEEVPDYSTINYSNELNLSIDSLTGVAAIESVNIETETFTKADYETTDTDRNGFSVLMETETRTFTHTEASDSDHDRQSHNLLLETSTNTRVHQEVTDSDPR